MRSSGKKLENNIDGQSIVNTLYEEHGAIQKCSIHLEFPKFDSEDPQGFMYKANQFFAYHHTNPQHWIVLASFHMEGKTLICFKDYEVSGGITS